MKRLFTLFLLLPLIGSAQNLLTNTSNRNTTTLNGTWSYIIDPYETGYYNYRHKAYDELDGDQIKAFYSNYKPKDKKELVEYDFDKAATLQVPGDWNSQDEKLLYYEGTIWYKKSFDYSLKENRRLFLYFGAVNYTAEVYLNGAKIGTHTGGFTPFNFEITNVVKPEDNYLVVKVDNSRAEDAVPTINTDWWNYGGITRDVKLIETSPDFIRDYKIQLDPEKPNVIKGFVQLDKNQAGKEIEVTIPELDLAKKVETNANGNAELEFDSDDIDYWNPDNPKLYKVNIEFAGEILEDLIGFRTIDTQGGEILLNEKPVFLKGISIHEENGMRGGRAYNEADALVLLNWAKELGCNYVRLAHYPHNEHILRLADKMGMMVWEEIPVYWTIQFSNKATLNNAETQLEEMITRDKNRAATIIWSVANETPPSAERNEFLKTLVNKAKELDDSRLMSAALEKHYENGFNIVDDEMGKYLDILAFNQYTGWYGGSLEEAPSAKWKIKYNKPVVISEFGGGALQGNHGSKDERWTEEYQEYLYEQNLKMIDKIPHISGMSPWILTDFRSPKRVLSGIQDGWNRKGLISNHGVKKLAFYTLKEYYENKKD